MFLPVATDDPVKRGHEGEPGACHGQEEGLRESGQWPDK